ILENDQPDAIVETAPGDADISRVNGLEIFEISCHGWVEKVTARAAINRRGRLQPPGTWIKQQTGSEISQRISYKGASFARCQIDRLEYSCVRAAIVDQIKRLSGPIDSGGLRNTRLFIIEAIQRLP